MTAYTSDSSPPFNPYFALISGVFAVSTGAIFARLADANPLAIAAYRVGIASLRQLRIKIDKFRLILYPKE